MLVNSIKRGQYTNVCGIYKLYFTNDKRFYIGSTNDLQERLQAHVRAIKKQKHFNKYFQRLCLKIGVENLKYEILAKCPQEYLLKMEQWFIDKLKPEYNIRKIADSNKGIKFTAEHKEKLSKSIKNSLKNKVDNSYRKRIGETQKITKLNKKNPYKRTEQGLVNNRIKRRSHSNIAKLDSEKVKDIKIMLKNKETMKTCANKYNVHTGTIQAIKSGLTWFDIKID